MVQTFPAALMVVFWLKFAMACRMCDSSWFFFSSSLWVSRKLYSGTIGVSSGACPYVRESFSCWLITLIYKERFLASLFAVSEFTNIVYISFLVFYMISLCFVFIISCGLYVFKKKVPSVTDETFRVFYSHQFFTTN